MPRTPSNVLPSRSFFVTWNTRHVGGTVHPVDEVDAVGPPEPDWQDLGDTLFGLLAASDKVQLVDYQIESGGDTQRRHIQMAILFRGAPRRPPSALAVLIQLVTPTWLWDHLLPPHIEYPACGADGQRNPYAQMAAYCTKEDTRLAGPWRHDSTNRGKRTDIDNFLADLRASDGHVDELGLLTHHPAMYFRYNKMALRAAFLLSPKPAIVFGPRMVVVLHGSSGCGKTHYAVTKYPGIVKIQVDKNGFISNYDPSSATVLIDEFASNIKFSDFSQMLDKYAYNVEPKGLPPVPWNASTIVITSNIDPRDWYPGVTLEQRRAICRRITHEGTATAAGIAVRECPPFSIAPNPIPTL